MDQLKPDELIMRALLTRIEHLEQKIEEYRSDLEHCLVEARKLGTQLNRIAEALSPDDMNLPASADAIIAELHRRGLMPRGSE